MYTNLFEAIPDGLILVDSQGEILRANSKALDLFGYPLSELVGESIELLVPENAAARHRAHRAIYTARPHVRAMGTSGQTLMGRRKDGSQFAVEIALSPIAEEGRLQVLASIRDVSESQRERQTLVRAGYDAMVARFGQLALEATDDEDLLSHAPALLAQALGIEDVLIALVSPLNEPFGIRASVGFNDTTQIKVDDPTFVAALMSGKAWIVDDLTLVSSEQPVFPTRPSSAGSVALVPLLDLGRPMGGVLAFSAKAQKFDHDALHLLQSFANLIAALVQRQRTRNELAHIQRLDALGQLTGGIAHDFNNLLTVMSGNLQLLEDEYEGQPEALELIESALRSVYRGADLTAKLLSFARRQKLRPQAVDLRAMLNDLHQMLGRTLGDSIRLSVACEEGLPLAHADLAQLDTALVNLALNARDAMPRGGEISIQAEHLVREDGKGQMGPGEYLVITVSDTGRGMSPATQARAMEPFFTTKDLGRGSGLGLSMVHGFAKQSGGDLWIDSSLGYGSRVSLCLPVDHAGISFGAISVPENFQGDGEKILLVEDDSSVRRIAISFLRKAGYQVHAVDTAEAALEVLRENPGIELLFTDILLGAGGNGRQLATEAIRIRPDLSVLLTSGFEEPSGTTVGGAASAIALLRKPYQRDQLLEAVRQALCA